LERISVVPNGAGHLVDLTADDAILGRLGLRRGRFVVALANAQKHKNVGVLFETFAAPAMADLTLVLVGADGREVFAAAGAPAPPGVVFAGRVSDPELRALYENAACLAFPSTTEGFGLPPLEAMSLGSPALVAPCGALPEVCGEAALYAPPDDPGAWAATIRRLTDDADLRRRLKMAGLARAALYRWEDSARRLLEIIEAVAGS